MDQRRNISVDDSDADGAFCALKPPLFVVTEDGEVLVYASVDDATRGLESPDVEVVQTVARRHSRR